MHKMHASQIQAEMREVQKKHGNDLKVNPIRVPDKYIPPSVQIEQLKINKPTLFAVKP